MARKKMSTTKLEIIQVATRLFLEKGFSKTSAKEIADELEISTGNLTFHFPTKEHLLAVVVRAQCAFQRRMMERAVQEGATSLLAVCLELMVMASASENSEIAHDFYIAGYTHPMALQILRYNDRIRAKDVFAEYCPHWTDTQYREAETLISGIEYATLMTTEDSAPLETRIRGALNCLMLIYNVPEDVRENKIAKVMALDYKTMGQAVFDEFLAYTTQLTDDDIEQLLQPLEGEAVA